MFAADTGTGLSWTPEFLAAVYGDRTKVAGTGGGHKWAAGNEAGKSGRLKIRTSGIRGYNPEWSQRVSDQVISLARSLYVEEDAKKLCWSCPEIIPFLNTYPELLHSLISTGYTNVISSSGTAYIRTGVITSTKDLIVRGAFVYGSSGDPIFGEVITGYSVSAVAPATFTATPGGGKPAVSAAGAVAFSAGYLYDFEFGGGILGISGITGKMEVPMELGKSGPEILILRNKTKVASSDTGVSWIEVLDHARSTHKVFVPYVNEGGISGMLELESLVFYQSAAPSGSFTIQQRPSELRNMISSSYAYSGIVQKLLAPSEHLGNLYKYFRANQRIYQIVSSLLEGSYYLLFELLGVSFYSLIAPASDNTTHYYFPTNIVPGDPENASVEMAALFIDTSGTIELFGSRSGSESLDSYSLAVVDGVFRLDWKNKTTWLSDYTIPLKEILILRCDSNGFWINNKKTVSWDLSGKPGNTMYGYSIYGINTAGQSSNSTGCKVWIGRTKIVSGDKVYDLYPIRTAEWSSSDHATVYDVILMDLNVNGNSNFHIHLGDGETAKKFYISYCMKDPLRLLSQKALDYVVNNDARELLKSDMHGVMRGIIDNYLQLGTEDLRSLTYMITISLINTWPEILHSFVNTGKLGWIESVGGACSSSYLYLSTLEAGGALSMRAAFNIPQGEEQGFCTIFSFDGLSDTSHIGVESMKGTFDGVSYDASTAMFHEPLSGNSSTKDLSRDATGFEVIFDKNSAGRYRKTINGVEKTTTSSSDTGGTFGINIFKHASVYIPDSLYTGSPRLNYFKIDHGERDSLDGTINLVPFKKDGEYGFLNLNNYIVINSDSFLRNESGSGEYRYVLTDKNGSSNLEPYERIPSLASTGNAYIDTGLQFGPGAQYYTVRCGVYFPSSAPMTHPTALFGGRYGELSDGITIFKSGTSWSRLFQNFGGSSTPETELGMTLSSNTWYDFCMTNKCLSINGKDCPTSDGYGNSLPLGVNFYIFTTCRNKDTGPDSRYFYGSFSYFRVERSGKAVFYGIPCRLTEDTRYTWDGQLHTSGELGFWDMVSGKFFGATQGTFSVGPGTVKEGS